MKIIFKSALLVVLAGLSGYFSWAVVMLMAIGGDAQNQWFTLLYLSFGVFALLSLISAFILVFKNRTMMKGWQIFALWILYLSPAIFIFTLMFTVTTLRQSKELTNDKKEVTLLMQKFHQQALSQGGFDTDSNLRSAADWFSTFGYGSVCNGDWTNELHPAHQVSEIYKILGKGDRELALSSVSCIDGKDSYALSVKFSDGSIKCIDKTGYFGPASALNTSTICIK